jgi:hypothetical protein
MPNPMTLNQVPRQALTKLPHPARDQHRPIRSQPTRRLQHQLAYMPRIGHVLKGCRCLMQLV